MLGTIMILLHMQAYLQISVVTSISVNSATQVRTDLMTLFLKQWLCDQHDPIATNDYYMQYSLFFYKEIKQQIWETNGGQKSSCS